MVIAIFGFRIIDSRAWALMLDPSFNILELGLEPSENKYDLNRV